MPSRISFFNQTLFRKNLTRFWPLWALPSFIGALFPLAVLTQFLQGGHVVFQPLDVTSVYYELLAYGVPVISLLYAVLVAVAVWSYLFSSRSVGLMHTLPARREGLFLTNFLSGMAMMLIPYAITGTLCILVFACFGGFEPVGVLVTILGVTGESLFYFSSATAAAFITGNLFAMPVLYFILHFLAVGLDALVCTFAQGFLFGVSASYAGVAEFLSPTVYLMRHVRCDRAYVERFVPDPVHGSFTPDGFGYYTSDLAAVSLENSWLIALYALAGAALLAVSWALYRRRRSESAGEVVAVGWMKPVFRYGVALCGALLGGLALYAIFWAQFQLSHYYDVIPLTVCTLIAGTISYYIASMLLAKSLRVFRGSLKGLALTAAGAAAVCCVLHFDLLGVETRVPSISQVEQVELQAANNTYTFYPGEEDALLEQVRQLHQTIIADQDYIREAQEEWGYGRSPEYGSAAVRLSYVLSNGTVLERCYSDLPLTRGRMAQADTYDALLDRLINSEAMKFKRLHAGDSRYQPESAYLYLAARKESYDLNSREAAALLDAVTLDAAAGSWGEYDWFDRASRAGGDYALDLSIHFEYHHSDEDGNQRTYYNTIGVRLRPEMTNTVRHLLDEGLVRSEDLVTYAQLYPEDFAEEQEAYASYEYAAAEICAYDGGGPQEGAVYPFHNEPASIGIIGGADGPTEIIVG